MTANISPPDPLRRATFDFASYGIEHNLQDFPDEHSLVLLRLMFLRLVFLKTGVSEDWTAPIEPLHSLLRTLICVGLSLSVSRGGVIYACRDSSSDRAMARNYRAQKALPKVKNRHNTVTRPARQTIPRNPNISIKADDAFTFLPISPLLSMRLQGSSRNTVVGVGAPSRCFS